MNIKSFVLLSCIFASFTTTSLKPMDTEMRMRLYDKQEEQEERAIFQEYEEDRDFMRSEQEKIEFCGKNNNKKRFFNPKNCEKYYKECDEFDEAQRNSWNGELFIDETLIINYLNNSNKTNFNSFSRLLENSCLSQLLCTDRSGLTPFNLACSKNDLFAIKALFICCKNYEKQDFYGKALNNYEKRKNESMTAKIFTKPDKSGRKPIDYAILNNNEQLANALLSYYPAN